MSDVHTVEDYIAGLPDDRGPMISKLRTLLKRRMPAGYHESMMWGAITYSIPLARFPDTYNGQPLGYVGLAAQKNAYSLYLMGCYMCPEQDAALRSAYAKAGRKLDMGKSCLRFKSLDGLLLDDIGRIIASTPVDDLVARAKSVARK